MSGQMSDVVVVEGEEFALIEPPSGTLIDLRSYGLKPVSMHSANTRGELVRFRILDNTLLVSDLQVGSLEAPPALGGVEATTDEYGQVWTYLGLDLPVDFTGDLVIGADPLLDVYVHVGFLPAWHYERVLAFAIESGNVTASEDRSEQVAAYRSERSDDEDEGVFERFLDSIKLRIGFDDGKHG